MSVQRVLPATLNDGLREMPFKPDAKVTRYETGGRIARHWNDETLKAYKGKIVPLNFNSNDIEDLKAFNHHIQGIVEPFWVVEPWVEEHFDVSLWGIANGSRRAFIVPFRNLAAIHGFRADGARIYTPGGLPPPWTFYGAANFIGATSVAGSADDNARFDNGIGDWAGVFGSETLSVLPGDGLDGRNCLLVECPGAVPQEGARLAGAFSFRPTIPASGAHDATVHCFVKGAGTFEMILETVSGVTVGSPVTGNPNAWKQVIASRSLLATDVSVGVVIDRQETILDDFLVCCVGISPGLVYDWFIPSSCPGVVDFDSAPDDGVRMSTSAQGSRMTRVSLDKAPLQWQREEIGHATPQNFDVKEVRMRDR